MTGARMDAPSAPAAAPWLSILLPVFGVGAVLDDCVASILGQGVGGIELVFVDDASTRDDAARLQAWQAKHPDRVRVVTHACNQGVAAARNTLLAHAHGTWLWFVDPDDLLEPGSLAALKGVVEASAPDIVLCDFRTFSVAEGSSAQVTRRAHVRTYDGRPGTAGDSREALVSGLFRTGQLHLWSKIVRRDAWPPALRFAAGHVFEDLAVAPRLALAARTHVHVPAAWVAYRQRAGSILATLDARKLDDWTLALTGFAHDMHAAGLVPSAAQRFDVAHFCARTMLRAVRRYRRLPASTGLAAHLRTCVERFEASSPLTAREMARAYLVRGMLGRWAQWHWTLRRVDR